MMYSWTECSRFYWRVANRGLPNRFLCRCRCCTDDGDRLRFAFITCCYTERVPCWDNSGFRRVVLHHLRSISRPIYRSICCVTA